MRLAISNLAWPSALDRTMFDRLARLGVDGVEVAPTRLADWDALPASLLTGYRARLEAAGLEVSSLQAVLFGRPELLLLGEDAAFSGMMDHMRHVAEIGAILGARVLVFGAPRNRLRADLEPRTAWALARDRFRLLGEVAFAAGIIIGIEPVPAVYGCDFLTSWPDVLRMVRDVDHPGVRVHLDTGCVALDGGLIEAAITECKDVLVHFHAAQPQLGDFQELLPNHQTAAEALRESGYDRWLAIEMREQPEDPVAKAEQAIRAVTEIYRVGCR